MKIGTFVEYKGYTGSIEYSTEDKIHYGSLLDIKDFINYEADTIKELFDEFHKAVDDYLTMCESIQKCPDIPVSKNINNKYWKMKFNDFVSGKPDKSGHYVIKNKYMMIGEDDYTTSDGGHWWNNSDDVLYSPSSFQEL